MRAGDWGKEAQNTTRLASILSISLRCKAKVMLEIYGQLNISLVRSVARAIISRKLITVLIIGTCLILRIHRLDHHVHTVLAEL